MSESLTVPYGLQRVVPEGVAAAYGAQWTVAQDGQVEVVHDRQGTVGEPGPKLALYAWMTDRVRDAPQRRAAVLLRTGAIDMRRAADVVLFEDPQGVIVANSEGSGRYLYVAAWLHSAGQRPAQS